LARGVELVGARSYWQVWGLASGIRRLQKSMPILRM